MLSIGVEGVLLDGGSLGFNLSFPESKALFLLFENCGGFVHELGDSQIRLRHAVNTSL